MLLTLIAGVFALVPAAYAIPPDQSWIAGLYDNADFDDVILFITIGFGDVQPSVLWSPHVAVVVVGSVSPADVAAHARSPRGSAWSRAPPLA